MQKSEVILEAILGWRQAAMLKSPGTVSEPRPGIKPCTLRPSK